MPKNNVIKKRGKDPLLNIEREQWIISHLTQFGKITIEEITSRFEVSKMTAWRDLTAIAEKNIAEKVYGGAIIR